jgi:tellurite resistance protein TehA-like permease
VKRHETDWTSLIAGVTFSAIAIAYLSSEIAHRTLEVRWVIPLLLIGLGVAGLASTVVRARRLAVRVEPVELPEEPAD